SAGIKEGDRITKVGPAGGTLVPFTGRVSGREQLAGLLATQPARTALQLEVKRKEGGKTETVTVTLDVMPNEVPDKLPEMSSAKKAQAPLKTGAPAPPAPGQRRGRTEERKDEPKEEKKEEKKDEKPETGFFERKDAAAEHTYWVYVPEGDHYDPNVSCT